VFAVIRCSTAPRRISARSAPAFLAELIGAVGSVLIGGLAIIATVGLWTWLFPGAAPGLIVPMSRSLSSQAGRPAVDDAAPRPAQETSVAIPIAELPIDPSTPLFRVARSRFCSPPA